jgi:acyl-CoA thioesterase FadM
MSFPSSPRTVSRKDSVYHDLFYEVRADLLEPLRTEEERYVVAYAEIDHYAEVRLKDEKVELTARVVEVGRKSLTVDHKMHIPGGDLAASSRVTLVGWSRAERKSRPISIRERTILGLGESAAGTNQTIVW